MNSACVKKCYSCLFAAIIIFLYYNVVFLFSDKISLDNFSIYFISILLYVLLYNFFFFIFNKINVNRKIEKFCMLLFIIISLFWIINAFFTEHSYDFYRGTRYLRHIIPFPIYFIVLGAITYLIYTLILKYSKCSIHSKYRIVLSSVMIFLLAYCIYTPNFLGETENVLFHIDAYVNSILNAVRLSPYSDYCNSIYGHYGIFYILPVKILHLFLPNTWMAVTITISLVGVLTYSLIYLVLNWCIKNDIVFALAALSISVPSFQSAPYGHLQIIPHRYFFQAIILAGCIYLVKHPFSKKLKAVMWIISMLGIVWNLEIGIVCAGVYYICVTYLSAKEKGKWKLSTISFNLLLFIAINLGAFGLVNLYNIIVGGEIISLKTYIFPIGGVSPMSDMTGIEDFIMGINHEFTSPFTGFIVFFIIMISVLCMCYRDIIKLRASNFKVILFLATTLGLGVAVYYINIQFFFDMIIVAISMVIVTSMLLDYLVGGGIIVKQFHQFSLINYISIFLLVLLSCMSLASVSLFPTLVKKYETVQDKQGMDEFANWVKSSLPENSVGFGEGVPEIFAYLNMHHGIYITDWPDVQPDSIKYLDKILSENRYEYVLVRDRQTKYLPDLYRKVDGYEMNGAKFYLYHYE